MKISKPLHCVHDIFFTEQEDATYMDRTDVLWALPFRNSKIDIYYDENVFQKVNQGERCWLTCA